MNTEKMFFVKNRSASRVVYAIPEEGIRREFQPGEEKKLSYDELEKLTFQAGGREIMQDYLLIRDAETTDDLNIKTEPEYYYTEEEIIDLMQNGSLDAFLDCLDFAPVGVIDLIKALAVQLPLNDMQKRDAIQEKTGFDVSAAVRHEDEERKEDLKNGQNSSTTAHRRVQPAEAKTEETPVRRTAPQTYHVVSRK